MSKLKGKDPALTSPGKIKMMTFSKSGIGKTWLSMDFPKPYYIDSEGGARLGHYQDKLKKAGGAYLGVEDGACNFETVLDQVQALATEKHPYQTLAITITKLFQTTIASEQEKLGEKDVFGASKKPAIHAMRRLVNWIHKIDMNVLFEAHETTEWGVNPRTGNREEIGNQPDVWDKLIYELDLTLRLEKRGNSRYGVVRKSRLLGFPEGESFPLEYVEFAKRYGKDFIEASVNQIVIATEEQVAEISKLVDLLKIDEKDIAKIMSKANAENWSELTKEQAESTLSWLKKRIEI
ncbi:MAG: AAA family ATPase [Bacteroidia bacterium]|nr:AAA family ATPase [Bacteroidia bacterium]